MMNSTRTKSVTVVNLSLFVPSVITVARWLTAGIDALMVPVLGCPLVLVLDLKPDEFGCLVHPSGVTFLLLNLGRQKKLYGSWRWIAQRLELAGTD
jgi:hypothetical protein